MRNIFTATLFLFFTMASEAQVSFIFLPDLYGKSVDGLGNFQLQNLSAADIRGRVQITVVENHSQSRVVEISTPVVSFHAGMNSFPRTVYVNSSLQFAGNRLGSLVNQTRQFPAGEYTFCYRFLSENKQNSDDYEQCFDGLIQPLVPISLIVPAQLDTICEKRPILSWQPPLPFRPGMRFRLMLTEKRDNDALVSLNTGLPLVLLDNISGTSINYPNASPELVEGKTYVWQVVAYEQGVLISSSEVWEFTVQCREPKVEAPKDSYRDLKLMANGNYYITNRVLRFSFRNNYHANKLPYTILDIAHGRRKIKHLPDIRLAPGSNKIDLDLSDLNLEEGKNYLLRVVPPYEAPMEVIFTYTEK